jgi:hypothetical protein
MIAKSMQFHPSLSSKSIYAPFSIKNYAIEGLFLNAAHINGVLPSEDLKSISAPFFNRIAAMFW